MSRGALAGAALAVLVVLTASACAGSTEAAPAPVTSAPSAAPTPVVSTERHPAAYVGVIAPAHGILGRDSVWSLDVRGAPVAAGSAAEVAGLVGHITDRYGGIAAFNAHRFEVSLAIAGPTTPAVDVAFDDCQDRGSEPAGLAQQLAGIPIPEGATLAAGTDHELSVWQPSTDRLWELYGAGRTRTGWSACYGGRLDHVSTAAGYFSGGFGASASELAITGGMVGIAEAQAGRIDHALSLAIPAPAAGRYVYPAQNDDGTSSAADAIPEGTRLRLDPAVDVATLPGLTPLGRAIARAAQTYGFIVTDTAGAVAVTAEDGAASEAVTGIDPWTAIEHGLPDYEILRSFPWRDLQVLPAGYGKPLR